MRITESDNGASPMRRWSSRIRGFGVVPVVLWLALALCVWALLARGPWASDDKKGPSLAGVPDEICSGIIAADDLRGVEVVRRTDKMKQRMDGDARTRLSCTVGGLSSGDATLRLEVQPLTAARANSLLTQTVPESAPLGPGLIGMAFPTSGWIVVPCPGSSPGEILARAEIRWFEPAPEDVFSTIQAAGIPDPQLATLLVHSANTVAAQLGCQIGTLPEPTVQLSPSRGASSIGTPCDAPFDETFSRYDFNLHATPVTPAPLEICRMISYSKPFGLQFTTYRGLLAKLAPTAGTEVSGSGRVAITTTGTCDGEPVVWTGWIREPGAGDSAVVAAHDRVVDKAVRYDHCVITDRVVAPDAAASPPATPTSGRPSAHS